MVCFVLSGMSSDETQAGAGGGGVGGPGQSFVPREDLVQALVNLGVTRNAAVRALFFTGNYNADLAAAWIFENQDTPNIDADFNEAFEISEGSSDDDVEEYLGGQGAYKMVFVVNMELGMGVGKVASQVAHAAIGLYRVLIEEQQRFGEMLLAWEQFGETKIVLKGNNAAQLSELAKKATTLGLPNYCIEDAGKTQVAPGSTTVLSVIGKIEDVNKVTGSLTLL
jgi:PTH2 family peptidyl-tRNA hydrolase